ncbi:MAG: 3-phosphoshikimate 1-carboxyvinyltransferase [Flavobacteriaceae bacterium]
MHLQLAHPTQKIYTNLTITGSKSETNRLLLLQALYPELGIENPSNSDDSIAMQKALKSHDKVKDIFHAGTAMRFLTAYYAAKEASAVVLTGSQRMQQRPIALLVDALKSLGAEISYEKNDGFPPLHIVGKQLEGGQVRLPANISSQYISALLLIAPKLSKGLRLDLEGKITSLPYIKMTLALLNRVGIATEFQGQSIRISPQPQIAAQQQVVESDWSSASYWFSALSLCEQGEVTLNNYRQDSLQGDAVLMDVYHKLGIESLFDGTRLILRKRKAFALPHSLELDLVAAPDIAQTIAVSCYGLGIECRLTGLHTLKIKETDRLLALEKELTKLGAAISVNEESLLLLSQQNFKSGQAIDTYHDHRMAMAFAPLALKIPLTINDSEVVSKSYPSFWQDMQKAGFQMIKK